MDTSETYIKMCDCEEIQELPALRILQYGNYYWKSGYKEGYTYLHTRMSTPSPLVIWIWLPRQDQLQEMVNWKKYVMTFTWLGNHRVAYKEAGVEYIDSDAKLLMGNSREQLWLVFVMKELYNKVWNGGEWIT